MAAVLAASGCGGPEDPKLPPLKRGDRDPANFMIVVDTSSSMADGDRLENAQQALSDFVRDLPASDSVGISAASTGFRSLVPIASVGGNRERLVQAIDGLSASGESRLYDAALESYGILRELAGSGRIDGVLLIAHSPDAKSNASPGEVRKLLSAQRGSFARVKVITVAYDAGRPARDALAEIARASDGKAYTSEPDGLERTLRRAWSGL